MFGSMTFIKPVRVITLKSGQLSQIIQWKASH